MHRSLICLLIVLSGCAQKTRPPSLALKMIKAKSESVAYTPTLPLKDLTSVKQVNTIAFGCCAHQSQAQDLWEQVAQAKPDLFLFAGNTVDSVRFDEKPLMAQYQKLDQVSSYQKIRQAVPFMATWDEQDYGIKNGDGEYHDKDDAKAAFLKYWNYIPKHQAKEAKGVEHSVIVGPEGKRVQIIMLDTRYYSSALRSNGDGSFKKNWNSKASLIGSQQWKWLKEELSRPADFRIVVSPLQLGANSYLGERWGLYPLERQNLFNMIRDLKVKNIVFVSGNRRFGAIAKVDLKRFGPLYDITSGPINGDAEKAEKDSHYIGKPSENINFGLINFDWKKDTVKIELRDNGNKQISELKLR
ncbi:alkaline phosphatase D family protein [Bdellovibrio reynosensis]|uniref:Alkaline phosphatase family protein n=1 Tax=Bdellovibrio reynosensis TaxID=2835041 RepID=A0ABY4C8R3_9BACT|nr:alkaline phosphatase D family protein [Bdellovibrio reynosensis]UOF01325.1 alkaline phosphatase family protein [Bdellovibrio reynosensis]